MEDLEAEVERTVNALLADRERLLVIRSSLGGGLVIHTDTQTALVMENREIQLRVVAALVAAGIEVVSPDELRRRQAQIRS